MVQRSLEGGVTLINSTVGIRRRFERALSQLQHQLQASESYSVQVYADINVHMANPELEHCPKTAGGKGSTRGEKWQTSSDTLHDTARRDREAAEKRLKPDLRKEKALLFGNGVAKRVDVDQHEGKDDEARDERGRTLLAQLAAELNMEASRIQPSRRDGDHGRG
ncbi:hypothetical protein M433DRAFT_1051 [Acidomyces richmondensis BFW]|nr:MAG: hypothetical protein FE78DRAFT_33954 [Acidomyces sp. 'richmondensis']KYG49483.1 hypothetical protein M433DRAFT_1051 [Acidomyces richmondensis BFW]